MSGDFVHDDNLVANALRLNWEHARHIESQRLQLAAIYLAMAFGLGFVALQPGDHVIRLGAVLFGLVVTLIVWAMTHKLNSAFRVQIWLADRCAKRLVVQLPDGHNEYTALHGFIGFPRRTPGSGIMRRINVRLMFNALYATFTLGWVVLFGYLAWRMFAPGVAL
jgi:hypothetical protein